MCPTGLVMEWEVFVCSIVIMYYHICRMAVFEKLMRYSFTSAFLNLIANSIFREKCPDPVVDSMYSPSGLISIFNGRSSDCLFELCIFRTQPLFCSMKDLDDASFGNSNTILVIEKKYQ